MNADKKSLAYPYPSPLQIGEVPKKIIICDQKYKVDTAIIEVLYFQSEILNGSLFY